MMLKSVWNTLEQIKYYPTRRRYQNEIGRMIFIDNYILNICHFILSNQTATILMVRTAWLWVSTLTLWDSTCSYLLKIAKLIFKVACIWDSLGYYCWRNYIIFKFQSPIVNFINLYNIWPEITCTFKKKRIR